MSLESGNINQQLIQETEQQFHILITTTIGLAIDLVYLSGPGSVNTIYNISDNTIYIEHDIFEDILTLEITNLNIVVNNGNNIIRYQFDINQTTSIFISYNDILVSNKKYFQINKDII